MIAPDELLSILERILPLIERDSFVLEDWSKTEDGQKVVQFVIQIGKYNTNFGQGEDISIGDGLDKKLLEEVRDLLRVSLREATPTQQSHPLPNIDWQQVSRSRLNEQIQRLTTNPLTHAEGITYRTEQVYVPLGLVERQRQSRRREDVPPEQGSLLYEETEITQKFEHEAFLDQVLRQGQSPRSGGRRIAVIGEPGAGKTTLLQQIACWVSENIDGAIVTWVSLADLQGQELEDYLLERWLPAVVQQVGQAEASTQVKDAFVAQVQQGRVWLLLDGVDEMQVSLGNPLSEIERQLRLGGLLPQARIVLTCRLNLWDGNRYALDTFDTYRTLEFSYPVQVEQFVGQWFEALPDAQAGQAEGLCAALKQPGKERIRDLVKNPLRLTLLCFNWYLGEGTLPETKAGLYEHFLVDFYEWKRERFPTTAEQRRQLNAALGELARKAIDKEETRFRLRHDFVCEYLGEPDEPNSLFRLALQLGWLNQVGVDAENRRKSVYAFFHPTFQEYFAALTINEWSFFLTHFRDNPNHPNAIYRAFEAKWKEVILLWLGKSNTPKILKEKILSELINFQDDSGGFYSFKAYFLAAEGIREFREYTEIESEKVILEIIKYAFGYFDKQHQKWCFFLKPVCQEARRIIRNSLERGRTEKYLLQLIELCPEPSVRWHVANTLDSLGTTNKKLKSILVTGVSSKLEPHVAKSLDQLTAKIRALKDRYLSSQKDEEFLVFDNEAEEIQGFEDNFYAGVEISELIQQIQNSEDWFVIARVSDHLQKTTQHTQLISFVENFKSYLLDLEEHLHIELEKTHFRCEYIYEIVWHCAQNISYPSFYGIWNN